MNHENEERVRTESRFASKAHDAVGVAGAALILTLTSVPASNAFAQEPAARASLEEVVVTARRREESAQSVPLVVSAINGEDLEAAGIEKLGDLTKIVPALSINDGTGRRNAPNYAIRAIRPTESIYGQDPSVAVYFADVVLAPAEGSNLALFDLQNVQVLKGPQGTLFGRNTNGGAILFTPKRPGTDFGGSVMLGYGNFNTIQSEFGVDLPVSERFKTRLSGKTFKRDGYQTNVLTGEEMGGEDAKSARLSAVWDITDSIENYTVVSYDQAHGQIRAPVITQARPGATRYAALAASLSRQQARGDIDQIEANDLSQFGSKGAYEDVDVWGGFNTTTFEFSGGLTLKNIAGYRYVKYASAFDQDGSAAPQVLESEQWADLHHFSDEIQLLGTALNDKLNWQTGMYYFHEQGSQFANGRVNGNTQYVGGFVDDDSYSFYAQGTYKFTPVWSLTVGGRYTQDEKSVDVTQRLVIAATGAVSCLVNNEQDVALPVSSCARVESESFSSPTGTVSLEYKPNDDALIYLASRYGYRAGGFNMRATTNLTWQPFEPEYVTDLELGTKVDWDVGDWRLRTNVALFHQWYEDIQRSVSATQTLPGASAPTVVTAVQNAAKATVDGAELEATIMPTDALSLKLTYAYLYPKYDEWTDTIVVAGQPQQRDLSGTPFQYIPEHQGSATLRYEIALGGSGETLALQGTYSIQSEVFINAFAIAPDYEGIPQEVLDAYLQSSYDNVDLNVTWSNVRGSNLELAAYVKNATDDRHIVGSISQYKTSLGFNNVVYNDPLTYGAQLKWRF